MEIYILDRELQILGVFNSYEAIIWNPKLHEPGTFKAFFIFSKKMNRILQRGNLVYKTDEEEPAVIRRKYLKLNKYGEETIEVQGVMVSRYLNQRIIWSKMIMKGRAEELMRKMVYEQVVAPADSSRRMEQIVLGEYHGYGAEMVKQVTYDNLQESLTDISKTSELGYRLRLDYNAKKLVFEVYKGTDRTAGSAEPCIFTRDYGNVYTQEYSEDDSNYRNVCLVGGTGEDTNRITTVAGQASGLDRYEMFYSASGMSDDGITRQEYVNQLDQKGKEKLASYYIAKAFESKINKSRAMKFALGDYMTCTDKEWNVTVNTQIKAIEKGLSKTEESFVVTFGNDAPTLIALIKAKE